MHTHYGGFNVQQDAFDAAMAAGGGKVTQAGAIAAVASWFANIDVGVAAGVLIGAAGLLTNLYFQHRRDKRESEYHRYRMSQPIDSTLPPND